ncbi:GGDEF domain-containing protein [Alginatibacterium sediminis]|uniref:diguanylate cyclase n=1 Tax=Alginatibacterium sediminis TaxID=2164068 RepID=A0A420EGX0_9ALTE|nr:GGDEF domain-containing protein [Alginatibacterium sediminis]RKF19939.1 GGDEF domain-containing protein [Alginatibacterium sediminis]
MYSKIPHYHVFPYLVICVLAGISVAQFDNLPLSFRQTLPWMPYALGIITSLLALQFNRRRLLVFVGLVASAYWGVFSFLQQPIANAQAFSVFTILSLILPSNLLLNLLLKDNGMRSKSAYVSYLVLALQVALIYIASLIAHPDALGSLQELFATRPVPGIVMSAMALAWCTLLLASLFFSCIYKPDIVRLGYFFGSLLCILALVFLDRVGITALFFSAAMFCVLISSFSSTYDLAYRDDLTGLQARRALNERLGGLSKGYVLAMADIDHFKGFNDKYGHDVGDDVLAMVAAKLDQVNGRAEVFRYGGEEFTLVFTNTDMNEAKQHLDEVRQLISSSAFAIRDSKTRDQGSQKQRTADKKPKKTVQITVSIGYAQHTSDVEHYDEVIKLADNALYKAKKKGRDCVVAASS